MKHATGERFKAGMRFFTPALYRRFNSPDDDVADRASVAWEAAIAKYRKYLDSLADVLPSPVQQLAALDLHDAELIGRHQEVTPGTASVGPPAAWSSVVILTLKQGQDVLTLVYLLWDHVREHLPAADWPFSPDRKHWLYDELDVARKGQPLFWHRILFSDGSVLEVPFVSVIAHRVRLPDAIPLKPLQ